MVRVWDCTPTHSKEPFDVVLFCMLDGHGHVGTHIQKHHTELIQCLSGCGSLRIGDQNFPFSFGHSYTIANDTPITLHNDAEEPLLYTITKIALP